jgi:hypothetical protein
MLRVRLSACRFRTPAIGTSLLISAATQVRFVRECAFCPVAFPPCRRRRCRRCRRIAMPANGMSGPGSSWGGPPSALRYAAPPVLARRGAALSSRLRHPQARRRGCYHVIHVSFLSRLRTEFRGKVSVTSFKMQHMIDRQTTTRAKESNKSVKPRGSTLGETKGNR